MKKLRVFEAFAGVGSQRMALRNLNIDHEVVGICEIDVDAIITYAAICGVDLNKDVKMLDKVIDKIEKMRVGFDFKLGKSKIPRMSKVKKKQLANANEAIDNFGDISLINPNDLPNIDLFTYSFPCQDISVAGKMEGISEATRSGLLYECEKIIENKKPKYLLLENVKNLGGNKFKPEFDKWLEYLEGLGYTNYWEVLNAKDYGIPQNRERVFVISILNDSQGFKFKDKMELNKRIKDILENKVEEKYFINKEFEILNIKFENYDKILQVAKTNDNYEQNARVYGIEGISPTLSARDYKDPKKILVKGDRIRKLTPLECWRLMGFSDEDFNKAKNVGISNSQLYKQAGNSIVVDVLEGIFENLFKEHTNEENN